MTDVPGRFATELNEIIGEIYVIGEIFRFLRKGFAPEALGWNGGALTLTDDMLMKRGAEGDEDAFRRLVERWEGQVFAFLLRMLNSREDAQDLTQETFLRMIRNASRYQSRDQFQSWLFRIAGNLARTRLRRRKIVRWFSFEDEKPDPPSSDPDPLADLERKESRAEVRRAIRKLPERQRQALVLKQYQDMKYQEIADTMDLTVGSVQMLLHRAMQALRKDLLQRKGTR